MSPISNRLHPRWWEDQRYALVALRDTIHDVLEERLGSGSGTTVVDLGAEDAPYRPLFEDAGCRYITCDLGAGADVQIQPGEPVPLEDASADLVVSFQVLEHVWDLEWYLGECRRLLKPTGWLILSTHGVWLYHPHPTDFRRWTESGLTEELRTHGFTPVDVRPVVGPLAWPLNFYLIAVSVTLDRLGRLGRALFVPIGALVNLLFPILDRLTPAQLRRENAAVYVVTSTRRDS